MKTKRRSHNISHAKVFLTDRLNALEFYKAENAYHKAFAFIKELEEHYKITQLTRAFFQGIVTERTDRWYRECQFLYVDKDGNILENQKDYDRIYREGLEGFHFWGNPLKKFAISPE